VAYFQDFSKRGKTQKRRQRLSPPQKIIIFVPKMMFWCILTQFFYLLHVQQQGPLRNQAYRNSANIVKKFTVRPKWVGRTVAPPPWICHWSEGPFTHTLRWVTILKECANYLRQGGDSAITSVCLVFCLSVRKLTQNVVHGFTWNFTKGRSWPSLMVISFWSWPRLTFTVI